MDCPQSQLLCIAEKTLEHTPGVDWLFGTQGRALNGLGVVQTKLSQYEKATHNYLRAIDAADKAFNGVINCEKIAM